MKRKIRICIYSSFILTVFLLLTISCNKEEDNTNTNPPVVLQVPVITTDSVSNITQTTATSGGRITSQGSSPVIARGVCWSTSQSPRPSDSHTIDSSGSGTFTSNITGLSPNTNYYVRAYATNSSGTAYGNELSFKTLMTPFFIGQSYQGGIIFYIDGTGQHGLIASIVEQGKAKWGCSGILIGTSATIGTGQTNTTAIVNGCSTAEIAARICDDLVLNGYSDWFLPSKDELYQMYEERNLIGNFVGYYYHSSSEVDSATVWGQNFYNGTQFYSGKNGPQSVRAVRAF